MAQQMDAGLGLPEPGGLMAQPRRLMATMRACANVYAVMRRWRSLPTGEGASWLQKNPDAARTYDYVMSLRENANGG